MDTEDIRVEQYDQDGKLVKTFVEQRPKMPPALDMVIADLEARLASVAASADLIDPAAATSLAATREQMARVKDALRGAARKQGG